MTQIDLSLEPHQVRRAVHVIGVLLGAATDDATSTDAFLREHLGATRAHLVAHRVTLSASTVVSAGIVLNELVTSYDAIVGPGDYDEPAAWTSHRVGDRDVSVPSEMTLAFPAGIPGVTSVAVALQISTDNGPAENSSLAVLTAAGSPPLTGQGIAAELRERIERSNPLRGKMLRASVNSGLRLAIVDEPLVRRDDVIVDASVWAEIDLSIRAVSSRRDTMIAAGFSTSRGIMLAGPPGVGKTAISRAIAGELLGAFTVIVVEPAAGSTYLNAIYEQTAVLGPCVVVLDDVDLYVGRRGQSNNDSLAGFLTSLDTALRHNDVLTVATTNDPGSLDRAATRAARFDSIIEVPAPSEGAVAAILGRSLHGIAHTVDIGSVARRFPPGTSGADVREAVRRAILMDVDDLPISTDMLYAVLAEGAHVPALPTGAYL
ncbi:ATP-binding protein [Gordonia soli]|uniref:AAA+ ATPase domain-containing protein n=1 Tax=Gordonia soli NBRC 108243 TaxID=1223545 RepID=M0QEB5_9ACTN|nr:ATP-binding protein [Gordonia soli]GAC66905.1 hypothetical protein GS4_05_01140 [Gordonia soli NBRC 108243]